jgi:hypothetical protein
MENQHRLIQTYRELSAEEIALINEIKIAEANLLALHHKIELHVKERYDTAVENRGQINSDHVELMRLNQAEPRRWLAIAKTDIQTGFMALVRSVAQPGPAKLETVDHG